MGTMHLSIVDQLQRQLIQDDNPVLRNPSAASGLQSDGRLCPLGDDGFRPCVLDRMHEFLRAVTRVDRADNTPNG